jgi:hypothetical protein
VLVVVDHSLAVCPLHSVECLKLGITQRGRGHPTDESPNIDSPSCVSLQLVC